MEEQLPVVETRGVTKLFGDGSHIVRALDGIDLRVNSGEFIAIMGPSGSGKSTLLHLLGALDLPTSGQILILGHDLAQVENLDLFRNVMVGFVFQLHNLIPTHTAMENVEIPLFERALGEKQRWHRAMEVLDLVGLAELADRLPNQLSGGQRQRVAIARALVNQPALLLADEPTGNLDSRGAADILALFQQLNRQLGTTIALVTHDPMMALGARRIVTLRDGRIRQDIQVAEAYIQELDALRRTSLGQLILGEARERDGETGGGGDGEKGERSDTATRGRGEE